MYSGIPFIIIVVSLATIFPSELKLTLVGREKLCHTLFSLVKSSRPLDVENSSVKWTKKSRKYLVENCSTFNDFKVLTLRLNLLE